MIKAFVYDKRNNACILKMKNIKKMEDKDTCIELIDSSGTVANIEKKPYKIRIYHN